MVLDAGRKKENREKRGERERIGSVISATDQTSLVSPCGESRYQPSMKLKKHPCSYAHESIQMFCPDANDAYISMNFWQDIKSMPLKISFLLFSTKFNIKETLINQEVIICTQIIIISILKL